MMNQKDQRNLHEFPILLTKNKTGKSSMQFSTHFSPPNAQDSLTWSWDISDNEKLDISKQEFTLDLSFLQNSNKGLGFSANCREWL